MSPATRRLILAVGAGLVAGLAAHFWRGYGVELALVTGIALGLFAFATQRTLERLRGTFGRQDG